MSRRARRRLLLGVAIGAALAWASLELAAMVPRSLASLDSADPHLYTTSPGNGVRVSFVETGRTRVPGYRLAQGLGLRQRDVVFRAMLVEHPRGNLLFGTGISPEYHLPPFPVSTPFSSIDVGVPVAESLADADIDRIVLPTPRWYHTGGLVHGDETPIQVGSSDRWMALRGPWPRRFAIDRARVSEFSDRIETVRWRRVPRLGMRKSSDLFQDGALVLVALKGSTIDEVGLLVTLDSGRRILVVADAVWTIEQVEDLRPRHPASTWLLDRNRMQLANLQRHLNVAWRDHELEIVPLLDGAVEVALYRERWD